MCTKSKLTHLSSPVSADVEMDADATTTARANRENRSNSALKREKVNRAARIEKKRVRKPRNQIVFKKHPKKGKVGKKG